MIGDQGDFARRLRLTLPARWFSDVTPVLDGVLAGISATWVALYAFLQFIRKQSRVLTASDSFLDMAGRDFLGQSTPRRLNEADDAFRSRIAAAMKRTRATRSAIAEAAAASGFILEIFEAARPVDTGCLNIPSSLAWGATGAWGSMQMPFECLLKAQRGSQAVDAELMENIAASVPAGGVGWIRIVD